MKFVEDLLTNPEEFYTHLEAKYQQVNAQLEELRITARNIESQITDNQQRRDRMIDLYADGRIDKDLLEKKIEIFEATIRKLEYDHRETLKKLRQAEIPIDRLFKSWQHYIDEMKTQLTAQELNQGVALGEQHAKFEITAEQDGLFVDEPIGIVPVQNKIIPEDFAARRQLLRDLYIKVVFRIDADGKRCLEVSTPVTCNLYPLA